MHWLAAALISFNPITFEEVLIDSYFQSKYLHISKKIRSIGRRFEGQGFKKKLTFID